MGDHEVILLVCMVAGAVLYTTVGHAGASAYIALMALFGVTPEVMRPTALVLNIIVASFTSYRFLNAGLFRWRTLWPVLIGAVPLAFIGGSITLPPSLYRPLVGGVLLLAAVRLLLPRGSVQNTSWRDPPVLAGVASGGLIGLLSGLTGTGGGIFLSPLLLFMRWSDTRTASGVAAVFILANSVAGLLGNLATVKQLPPSLPIYAAGVLVGAVVGTQLGTRWLAVEAILKVLGLVLLVASMKMFGVY
jgi:uncharacterized membrane protein YfcA